ncbi:MAG: hypothetical protein LBM21_02740 [Coriobacteriales bacterium]|jgi:hypothetical protein|nr:hypothetical protein [Coriobacteriales bacterium]
MSDDRKLNKKDPRDKAILYALDQARTELKANGAIVPFLEIIHEGEVSKEAYPGVSAVDCFKAASASVTAACNNAESYVFCYDGYVDMGGKRRDAILAESANAGDNVAEVFGVLYTIASDDTSKIAFDDGIYSVGNAASLFMSNAATTAEI